MDRNLNANTNNQSLGKVSKDNVIVMNEQQKNDQALNAISSFLDKLKVKRIIYVDDRCSINELEEAFRGKLKSYYNDKPAELSFIDWELPYPFFEDEIKKLWDEKDEDQKRQLYLEILKFEGEGEELENSVAPLMLKKFLKDKIDLLSPSEWIARQSGIIRDLSETSKILFLFDIEFKYAPLSSAKDGRDLAAELLQNNQISNFLYCGIFSHLFSIDEEYEKRSEYCGTHGLEKERFYTISKKRFQNDSYLPGLAEGIRNTLIINEVELLKSEASELLKNSFAESITEINELTPESFNHIIQKSSFEEGVWEMATLIRISNIITTDKALNRLALSTLSRTKINESLGKVRAVENIKTGGGTPYNKNQVFGLRTKELYTKSNIQNQLHYPLSNGDIFKIQAKEYILLVQPCNVALRSNGSRNRKYNLGSLVELEVLKKEDYLKYPKERLQTVELVSDYLLPDDENVTIAKFPTFQSVSLSPLDLTVFNIDGKAKINLDEKEKLLPEIQESWKKHYRKLYEEFSAFSDGVKAYKKIKIKNKDALKESVFNGTLFVGYKIDNENSLIRGGKELVFNIERIAHYKSPYSDDLLQKFMSYLSRNAFEHDFTKLRK